MKSFLRLLAAGFCAAGLLLPVPALASDELSEGTVRRVDTSSQRVRLAHGPIANLNMPPMTMMFKVKEPAMLEGLKEGAKVRFRVEEIDGGYVVVRIEAAK